MGDGRRKVGGDGDDRGRERVPLFSPDYKENGRNNVNKEINGISKLNHAIKKK